MTSHHDKGQMFGTDGKVTWTEPELFDELVMVVSRCDKCHQVILSLNEPWCATCDWVAP